MNQKNPKKRKEKTKLPLCNYRIRRFQDYQKITDDKKTKMFMFMNLLGAITDGISEGVEQVGLCELKGSNASIFINKRDWKTSLNKAMDFFAEIEAFETAQRCKNLIDTL